MLSSLLKRQRRGGDREQDRDSPPTSPASFYSPNLERSQDPNSPPVPSVPLQHTVLSPSRSPPSLPLPSVPTTAPIVSTAPVVAFPHGTRFPWPPPANNQGQSQSRSQLQHQQTQHWQPQQQPQQPQPHPQHLQQQQQQQQRPQPPRQMSNTSVVVGGGSGEGAPRKLSSASVVVGGGGGGGGGEGGGGGGEGGLRKLSSASAVEALPRKGSGTLVAVGTAFAGPSAPSNISMVAGPSSHVDVSRPGSSRVNPIASSPPRPGANPTARSPPRSPPTHSSARPAIPDTSPTQISHSSPPRPGANPTASPPTPPSRSLPTLPSIHPATSDTSPTQASNVSHPPQLPSPQIVTSEPFLDDLSGLLEQRARASMLLKNAHAQARSRTSQYRPGASRRLATVADSGQGSGQSFSNSPPKQPGVVQTQEKASPPNFAKPTPPTPTTSTTFPTSASGPGVVNDLMYNDSFAESTATLVSPTHSILDIGRSSSPPPDALALNVTFVPPSSDSGQPASPSSSGSPVNPHPPARRRVIGRPIRSASNPSFPLLPAGTNASLYTMNALLLKSSLDSRPVISARNNSSASIGKRGNSSTSSRGSSSTSSRGRSLRFKTPSGLIRGHSLRSDSTSSLGSVLSGRSGLQTDSSSGVKLPSASTRSPYPDDGNNPAGSKTPDQVPLKARILTGPTQNDPLSLSPTAQSQDTSKDSPPNPPNTPNTPNALKRQTLDSSLMTSTKTYDRQSGANATMSRGQYGARPSMSTLMINTSSSQSPSPRSGTPQHPQHPGTTYLHPSHQHGQMHPQSGAHTLPPQGPWTHPHFSHPSRSSSPYSYTSSLFYAGSGRTHFSPHEADGEQNREEVGYVDEHGDWIEAEFDDGELEEVQWDSEESEYSYASTGVELDWGLSPGVSFVPQDSVPWDKDEEWYEDRGEGSSRRRESEEYDGAAVDMARGRGISVDGMEPGESGGGYGENGSARVRETTGNERDKDKMLFDRRTSRVEDYDHHRARDSADPHYAKQYYTLSDTRPGDDSQHPHPGTRVRKTHTDKRPRRAAGGGGGRARNSHRLTRQDSATLPFDQLWNVPSGASTVASTDADKTEDEHGEEESLQKDEPDSQATHASQPTDQPTMTPPRQNSSPASDSSDHQQNKTPVSVRLSKSTSRHRHPERRNSGERTRTRSQDEDWSAQRQQPERRAHSSSRQSLSRHLSRSRSRTSRYSRSGSVPGSRTSSRPTSPGVSAGFHSEPSPMPNGAAEFVKEVSGTPGPTGKQKKRTKGPDVPAVQGAESPHKDDIDPEEAAINEGQIVDAVTTAKSRKATCSSTTTITHSGSMQYTQSSRDGRASVRKSDVITLEDVLTGNSGYGNLKDYRISTVDVGHEKTDVDRGQTTWDSSSAANVDPPHTARPAAGTTTVSSPAPAVSSSPSSHSTAPKNPQSETPAYSQPRNRPPPGSSILLRSQSAQPAMGTSTHMGSDAGTSTEIPSSSSLGLSLGRHASATTSSTERLPPLGDRREEYANTQPPMRVPPPTRQLPPNPDDGASEVVSDWSTSESIHGDEGDGDGVFSAPYTSSQPRHSAYPAQQPAGPRHPYSSHFSQSQPAQLHPNLASFAEHRYSSAPSYTSTGTPDASSLHTFEPSTSSTSLTSVATPSASPSPSHRNGSPDIPSESPKTPGESPGMKSEEAPAMGVSPAVTKLMHPPRPSYRAWTSSKDLSQTPTKTPPTRAERDQTEVLQVNQAQINDAPATPGSAYSSVIPHSATTSVSPTGAQGSGTTGGTHGLGVRRVSGKQVTESPGTSPVPSNRLSRTSSPGTTQTPARGTLPIGNSSNNKPPVGVVERLQQRSRSNSETKRGPANSPAKATIFDDAFTERNVRLHRKNTTDSVAFPQTPQEFSPLLTPSFENLGKAMPQASIVSVPNHSMMPEAPIIDPAPPPKKRSRPPLPTGPREPSGRAGGAPGATTSNTGVVSPAQRHGSPSSSSSSSSVSMNTNATASVAPVTVMGRTSLTTYSGSDQGLPPTPKFRTRNVRWRGLTMDAAKWTFTSKQLQDIVGRAIRQSAEASSIRLLTLEVFDREIPEEIKRLELLRDNIKSKYRAYVQQRHVLFRSMTLNSKGIDLRKLSQEVLEISIACDQLTEDLFHVMDWLQQLNTLRTVHSASALAMALRKLNSSFLKGSENLEEMSKQMTQLEAERDEAWAMAERVEQDLIDLQAKVANLTGTSTPGTASNRSSRVSAARKTSIRASQASLRFSRGARSSRSSTSSQQPSALLGLPPVPPVPRIAYASDSQKLLLNTDLPSASVGSPSLSMSSALPNSPTSEARALAEAQNELYNMLGISRADLRRKLSGRHRPTSELSPSSVPGSPLPSSTVPLHLPSEVARPSRRRRNASFSGHPRPADSMYADILED